MVYLCHAPRPGNVPLVQPALPLQPPLYVHRRRFAANFVSFALFPVQYPHLRDFFSAKYILCSKPVQLLLLSVFRPINQRSA